MAITTSTGSAVAVDTNTGGGFESKTCSLPSDAPAGATIFVGIYNRTDNTTTLSSVSDPVNGSWTLTGRVSGPTAVSTSRSWFVVRENTAALSGAGNRVITVTLSAGVSTQLVAGWIDLDGSTSALTFDNFATVATSGSALTDIDSNTAADTDAGAIVGFCTSNAAQSSWSEDSGGSVLSTVSGVRVALFYKAYSAGGGPYGFTTTPQNAAAFMFHVAANSEPSAGGAAGPLIGGKLVGSGILGGRLVG